MAKKLTKNQLLVFELLQQHKKPLTAYNILDLLRDSGFRAPLQVYRALDKLIEYKYIHRLESINAFTVCSHHECGKHGLTAFALCHQCGDVIEIEDNALLQSIDFIAVKLNFTINHSMIELNGLCHNCKSA